MKWWRCPRCADPEAKNIHHDKKRNQHPGRNAFPPLRAHSYRVPAYYDDFEWFVVLRDGARLHYVSDNPESERDQNPYFPSRRKCVIEHRNEDDAADRKKDPEQAPDVKDDGRVLCGLADPSPFGRD